MTGLNWATLLVVLIILGAVCRALHAPTWLTIAGPLAYCLLVVLVVTV